MEVFTYGQATPQAIVRGATSYQSAAKSISPPRSAARIAPCGSPTITTFRENHHESEQKYHHRGQCRDRERPIPSSRPSSAPYLRRTCRWTPWSPSPSLKRPPRDEGAHRGSPAGDFAGQNTLPEEYQSWGHRLEELQSRARLGLDAIDRANISTIHSFAYSLLKRFPLEAGVDPTPKWMRREFITTSSSKRPGRRGCRANWAAPRRMKRNG